jgi:hypothetical protein
MASVFIDRSVLTFPTMPEPERGPEALAPEVLEALRHLTEAQIDVVVLNPTAAPPPADLPSGLRVAERLPRRLGRDAWFLTADPDSPFGRPRGARTMLVGPRRSPGPAPLPRYDVEARDLSAAVLEILTRQAMA